MARTALAAVALLLASGLLAGCSSGPARDGGGGACPPASAPGKEVRLTPLMPGFGAVDSGVAWDYVSAESGWPANATSRLANATAPPGWTWDALELSPRTGSDFLMGVHFKPPTSSGGTGPAKSPPSRTPGAGTAFGAQQRIEWGPEACALGSLREWTKDVGPDRPTGTVAAGQGVHVWYAGFWENGTLFATNVKAIEDAPLRHAGWYQGGDYAALPVYVYDKDRSEEPPQWKDPFTAAGPAPAPLAPVDAAAGAGYYTTIKGFNEALKGLGLDTQRAAHIAPKDAYTDDAHKGSPLYGAALVFLVKVEDIQQVPCPSPTLPQGTTEACPGAIKP